MRQFLAAELPPPLHHAAVAWGQSLQSRLKGWRWVGADGVHLTLRFLGQVSDELDRSAREAVRID